MPTHSQYPTNLLSSLLNTCPLTPSPFTTSAYNHLYGQMPRLLQQLHARRRCRLVQDRAERLLERRMGDSAFRDRSCSALFLRYSLDARSRQLHHPPRDHRTACRVHISWRSDLSFLYAGYRHRQRHQERTQ